MIQFNVVNFVHMHEKRKPNVFNLQHYKFTVYSVNSVPLFNDGDSEKPKFIHFYKYSCSKMNEPSHTERTN